MDERSRYKVEVSGFEVVRVLVGYGEGGGKLVTEERGRGEACGMSPGTLCRRGRSRPV